MQEVFGTVVAILISVYLMFIAPLNFMVKENEKMEQMYILNEITMFTEQVRNTGEISDEMYLNLNEKISGLNGVYDVEIIHYQNEKSEDSEEILYFEKQEYLEQIKKYLSENKVYYLDKNEFIKIIVSTEEKVVAVYGGSIKNDGGDISEGD